LIAGDLAVKQTAKNRIRMNPARCLRFLCLACAAWANSAIADPYLVLSLVGDRITIVTAERPIGTRIDRNRVEVRQLPDRGLDDFVVRAAGAAIEKARPAATVTMLRANDPALYALRNSWLDSDAIDVKALVALVTKLVSPPPDSRLLLIAPYRGELELKAERGYLGSGKYAGLGFYVDVYTPLQTGSAAMQPGGKEVTGFLGVFANFQLLLIDLRTNNVDAHQSIVIGAAHPAADAPDGTPWNALSAARKAEVLQSLLQGEIERVVPGMLGPSRP
jgi:hypothetical protein